jgi:hypothetical protein
MENRCYGRRPRRRRAAAGIIDSNAKPIAPAR